MYAPFDDAVRLVMISAIVLAYYGVVVEKAGDHLAKLLLRATTERLRAAARYSTQELDGILRLMIAGVMQLAFCGSLIIITGVDPGQLISHHFDATLIVYGVLLGIGEAALGSFFGYLGIQTAMQLAPKRVPQEIRTWLALSKGGWIRYYLNTVNAAPTWLTLVLAGLYVSVEEVVFRGILINSLLEFGAPLAVAVSTVLFMAVQVFNMPSWQSALFPVVGALVIGLLHGIMYVAVPDLLPLIVAHMVAFAITVI